MTVQKQIPLFAIMLAGEFAYIHAQDGFCMVNGTTTGGAGGPTFTVTNGTDFNTQINIAGASATNQMFLPIDPANGSVFLRLVYP